jgi:FMN-dependent oxidoreductase (nitrilotriacetate monooxygenase family)
MSGDGRYLRLTTNLIPGALSTPDGRHPAFDIDDFVRSARLAEGAGFDAVFFADSQGIPPNGRGFSYLDPLTLLPAIARDTEHIGLVATASTTYTAPYALARAILSIDHISHGRAGWNIITTMDSTVARNFGTAEPPGREERYRRATEFAQVVLKLWESWTDDIDQPWDLDNLNRRPIDHHGEYYSVAGPLQVPKSRQGRPALFQAGGSGPGIDLAATFADAVFSVGVNEAASLDYREQLNKAAREQHGDEAEVLVLPGLYLTLGSTQAEADRLLAEAEAAVKTSNQWRFLSRYGLDLDTVDLDGPVPPEVAVSDQTNSIGFAQGGVDLARSDPSLTLRRFIVYGGGGHRRIFGTPESVTEELLGWFRRGAADGFTVFVDSLPQFVEHIVPLLRAQGVHRRAYTGRTLRDNLRQHAG